MAIASYFDLYPDRFLHAEEFNGRDVTLTIKKVEMEKLTGDDNKPKDKVIITFEQTSKALVACKTNGLCIKLLFGPEVKNWYGKRVTLFPRQVESFGKLVWAIRVRGSPDIPSDVKVDEKLGRGRLQVTLTKTLPKQKTGNGKSAPPSSPTPAPAPPVAKPAPTPQPEYAEAGPDTVPEPPEPGADEDEAF